MTDDKLTRLLRAAVAKYNSMTKEQKREHDRAQRRSWVIGNMMLCHPEMTRERAEQLYSENCE